MTEFEQTQEKLVEMTLDGEEKKQESASAAVSGGAALPLVGGGTVDEDSDSDSEPIQDIDDVELEDDDPVGVLELL